jgi:hypothetical protein
VRPSLAAALADGELAAAAARTVRLWHRAWKARVNELRRSDAITAKRTLSQAHRAFTDLMRAFTTRHATLATFLSEPLDGLQRWQRACPSMHPIPRLLLYVASAVSISRRRIYDHSHAGYRAASRKHLVRAGVCR